MKPTLDQLATTAEIGRMLGMTRERARQIADEEWSFPEPIGKLGHYTVWWRPEVERWLDLHRPSWRARTQHHAA